MSHSIKLKKSEKFYFISNFLNKLSIFLLILMHILETYQKAGPVPISNFFDHTLDIWPPKHLADSRQTLHALEIATVKLLVFW